MNGIQSEIARRSKFSAAFISQIFTGARRVTKWTTAKRLAEATGTAPELWLEKKPAEIRRACQAAMDDN